MLYLDALSLIANPYWYTPAKGDANTYVLLPRLVSTEIYVFFLFILIFTDHNNKIDSTWKHSKNKKIRIIQKHVGYMVHYFEVHWPCCWNQSLSLMLYLMTGSTVCHLATSSLNGNKQSFHWLMACWLVPSAPRITWPITASLGLYLLFSSTVNQTKPIRINSWGNWLRWWCLF